MNIYQRAAQFWAVLALAASNRQILNYKMLSRLVGMPPAALGGMLEPIQTFCQRNNLPPLTVLVVQQDSGLPGTGFIAAADIPKAQADVFNYDWLDFGAPSPDNIKNIVEG
ncbi:MAG: hypothetical protein WCW35_05285 [Bacteroidota bacterium]